MSADELACTITRIVRTERFVEGTLHSAGADGILMRLAQRAELCVCQRGNQRMYGGLGIGGVVAKRVGVFARLGCPHQLSEAAN